MDDYEYKEYIEMHKKQMGEYAQKRCYIIEMEFEGGHKHEYIMYSSGDSAGLTHYPDCKYCKQRGIYYSY